MPRFRSFKDFMFLFCFVIVFIFLFKTSSLSTSKLYFDVNLAPAEEGRSNVRLPDDDLPNLDEGTRYTLLSLPLLFDQASTLALAFRKRAGDGGSPGAADLSKMSCD